MSANAPSLEDTQLRADVVKALRIAEAAQSSAQKAVRISKAIRPPRDTSRELAQVAAELAALTDRVAALEDEVRSPMSSSMLDTRIDRVEAESGEIAECIRDLASTLRYLASDTSNYMPNFSAGC